MLTMQYNELLAVCNKMHKLLDIPVFLPTEKILYIVGSIMGTFCRRRLHLFPKQSQKIIPLVIPDQK